MYIFGFYISFGFFWKILIVMAVSVLCGLILSVAYQLGNKRSRQLSQPFSWLIVVMPSLVAVVIFIVEDNFLRAMYLLGATTLIRFRNPVKNPLTTVFVLATVGVGACVGFHLYLESLAVALLCLFVVWIIGYWGIAGREGSRILYLECQNVHHPEVILESLQRYVRRWFPMSLEIAPSGDRLYYSYGIEIYDGVEVNDLVRRFEGTGIKVHLIEPRGGEDF